jgi:hypothetical protein
MSHALPCVPGTSWVDAAPYYGSATRLSTPEVRAIARGRPDEGSQAVDIAQWCTRHTVSRAVLETPFCEVVRGLETPAADLEMDR